MSQRKKYVRQDCIESSCIHLYYADIEHGGYPLCRIHGRILDGFNCRILDEYQRRKIHG